MAIRKRRSFARPIRPCGDAFKVGSRMVRWHENPESAFRLVGTAEDIARREMGGYPRDYGGWYLDSCQDETAHGVVFRAPGGRGFIAGVRTSRDEGSAMLAICERPEESAMGAARYANQLAEWYAESERQYQDAWHAGNAAGYAWREAMSDALDSVSSARVMLRAARVALRRALAQRDGDAVGMVPPELADESRRLYRQALESCREKLARACETRREAWRVFRSAQADHPWQSDAFAEGAAL